MSGDAWRRDRLTAAAAALLAAIAGFLTLDPPAALVGSAFAALVAAAAVHDLAEYRLPDGINAAILVLGLGFALFRGGGQATALVEPMILALIVAALMMALRSVYRALRGRSGLGLGDVKLAAAGSVWLAPELVAWALLIAALAAILLVLALRLRGEDNQAGPMVVPFGAFLGPAFWLVWYAAMLAGG